MEEKRGGKRLEEGEIQGGENDRGEVTTHTSDSTQKKRTPQKTNQRTIEGRDSGGGEKSQKSKSRSSKSPQKHNEVGSNTLTSKKKKVREGQTVQTDVAAEEILPKSNSNDLNRGGHLGGRKGGGGKEKRRGVHKSRRKPEKAQATSCTLSGREKQKTRRRGV